MIQRQINHPSKGLWIFTFYEKKKNETVYISQNKEDTAC